MGPLIFYLGSIIECILANSSNQDRLFKDLADHGYKINLRNNNLTYVPTTSNLVLFVPFLNLIDTCLQIQKYNHNIHAILKRLQAENLLIPLTTAELMVYNQNRSAKVAKEITIRSYNQRINASLLIVKETFGVSKFRYSYDYYNHKIVIYASQGKLSTLPVKSQEELINRALRIKTNNLIKDLGGLTHYFQAMDDGLVNQTTVITEDELFQTEQEPSYHLAHTRKKL